MYDKIITVRVSHEQKKKIQELAKKQKKSKGKIIREALGEKL